MNATRWTAGFATLCGLAGQALAIDAVSRFESGLVGWTLEGPGTIEWSPTGGSSGGCLRVTRTGPGELYLVAPPAFSGNWEAGSNRILPRLWFNYNWSNASSISPRPLQYEVSGPAGSATNVNNYPGMIQSGVWSMVSIYEWSSRPVFTDVTQLKIRIGVDASLPVGEVMLLDNIGQYACDANCDGATTSPILTANDFQCYLNSFAVRNAYSDFDGMPWPTANDFQAFLNSYAQGCSAH